jgi:hypothetical protein
MKNRKWRVRIIRVFDIDFSPALLPRENVDGKWELVSPQTISHISAAAYLAQVALKLG